MWVNVFVNDVNNKYLLVTDEEIECILKVLDEPVYCDNILLADGYGLLSANLHSYSGAAEWVKKYFPQYTPVSYKVIPISFKTARAFIDKYHRTHKTPQGCKFTVAVSDGCQMVGVAVAGRPVSRVLDDGHTLELTRMCVKFGFKNVCSLLYSRAAKIAKEMGYGKIITYIAQDEPGYSLKAAGWEFESTVHGHDWNCSSRPRNTSAPICNRQRWYRILTY